MARGGKREGAGRKPGTVTKAKRELAEMAKDHAEAALNTLVAIHKDVAQSGPARVSAAVHIIDRAYGKPPQAIIGDPEKPLLIADATDQKRIAAVALLAAREAMKGANGH